MAINVGDIFRYTTFATYLGQELLNVYFFEVTSIGNPQDLLGEQCQAISDIVIPPIANRQVTGVNYYQATLENLTNGLEIATIDLDIDGENMTAGLPSYVAVNIKLPRFTKITRNGAKRYSGIAETAVVNNQLTQDWSAVANTIGGILNVPADEPAHSAMQADWVIVGRTKNMNGVYELDLSKINRTTTGVVSPNISTQNTRKTYV